MTEIFGIPMSVITWVLVGALALALISVAVVAVRNRILFAIGLRNIPRRPAQSVLIVLGLMLSTAIIAAALATGDTVTYSITNETYQRLGSVDEIVQRRDNQDEASLKEEQIAPSGPVPKLIVNDVFTLFNGNDDVDGIMPALRFPAPVGNPQLNILKPEASIIGIDPASVPGFEDDFQLPDGRTIDFSRMRDDEAIVNESAAKALKLKPGNMVDIYINRVPRTFYVSQIAKDRLLTGWTQGRAEGIMLRLDSAQQIYGFQDEVGFVAVSNRGGVRSGLDMTGRVAPLLQEATDGPPITLFETSLIKKDRVDRAEAVGANMTQIFVVLGMFTIAAGTLLVFLILVMLATERRSEMGMSRAVGMKRGQLIEAFMAEGMAYSITAGVVGALLGVLVSLAMTRVMAYIFNQFDVAIAFHVTWRSIVAAYCVGVVLTFLTVVIAAWRVSNLSVVAAIRDQSEPARPSTGILAILLGGLMFAAGVGTALFGLLDDRSWAFGAGASLVIIGAAFLARRVGQGERPVFTIASVLVLALWIVIAGDTLRDVTGPLDSGLETFFIGGVLMVAAATFIVVYNAEMLFGGLRAVGFIFSRAMPAVQTAVAYPLGNKFRTGMTIAMMSLVMFALVMISTVSLNFRNLFLSDDSLGGWDIQVQENPTNPLTVANDNKFGVLGEALDRNFYDTRSIDTLGQVYVGNPRSAKISQLKPGGEPGNTAEFLINGADDVFLLNNTIGLQARAAGFDSDRAVWDAVIADPTNAVIDGTVVPGINYANVSSLDRFTLEGYESGTRSFTPFAMQVQDQTTLKTRAVRIIGIMNRAPSETYRGLWINLDAFASTISPLYANYYIRTSDGYDAANEAQKMETALAAQGVEAVSIHKQVEEDQALNSAFFYLVQGFMALGLIVGLAALGVIAFRTVVERRQQIGLMRAIGFSRANVQLTFILESAFIALLGIVIGTGLALLLANRILQSDQFSTAGFTTFYIPWLQIAVIALLVFLAAVLTTLIPSRQASSIPVAEAIRYE
jgi:putative ABC transport system permease protein